MVQISPTVANYNVIAINRLNQGISSTAKSSPSGKCSLCHNEIILSFWNSALKSSIYTRRMTLNTGELVNPVQAHIISVIELNQIKFTFKKKSIKRIPYQHDQDNTKGNLAVSWTKKISDWSYIIGSSSSK